MKAQPATREDIAHRVKEAAAAAISRQAIDLKVLELAEVSDFTDFFLVCSGSNERQVQAIADAIEKVLRPAKIRPLHSEGFDRGQWILMDYGDFLVHVFLEEPRRFYDLERLWSDAPDVTKELTS